jgi:hypothetical protein
MAIINKGKTFANGEQLTADKLNQVIDNATFTASAVDNVSTQLSSGAIIVKDGGVTTAKLNNGGVTTAKIADSNVTTAKILDANVTKAKIENLSDYTVLGNVSGGAAAPAEVSILDEDDMASDSDTAIATQQSIKAYVDNVISVFTKSFESAEQNIPAANDAVLTISHGLGEIPKLMEMVYRCKTNDNGWIAGDEIVTNSQTDSGYGHWSVVKNITEVKFRGVSNKRRFAHGTSSNTAFTPDSPNWKIVFRAYA